MRLPTSWRRVIPFWDHIFEAGERGVFGLLRRRQKKPASHPIRRRNYYPTGEYLEQRQLFTAVFFAGGSSLSTGEGSGSATLQLHLDSSSNSTITVTYATSDGTATAGQDYTTSNGTVTFAPHQTQASFSVPIIDDTLDEDAETFTCTLSNPINATLGIPSVVTVTINDNDGPPTVQFATSTYTVAETAGSLTITAVLSTASGKQITVDYATANGTATAGSDYTSASGTLTFNPGDVSKTFNVSITNDSTSEYDETFTATLSNPSSTVAIANPSTTTVTIQDDESSWISSSPYQGLAGGVDLVSPFPKYLPL